MFISDNEKNLRHTVTHSQVGHESFKVSCDVKDLMRSVTYLLFFYAPSNII